MKALAARRALDARGKREVDMRAIVRTAVAQREIVNHSTKMTALARRRTSGRPKSSVDNDGWGSLRGVDSSKLVPFVEDTD